MTLQGKRCFQHDYCAPCFYMVTMTTLNRAPLFGACNGDCVTPSRDGWLVYELWHDIPKTYPQIETSTFVIMPDHIHAIIHVKERMEKPVGVPLRAFKSIVTSAFRKRHSNPNMQVWNPGYHDLCVWRPGSLKAYTNYIRDNPRRLSMKLKNPDLFIRVNDLAHARLPKDHTWNGYGNLFLLDRPILTPVQVSRHIASDELAALKLAVQRDVANSAVIISPFISPGEKETVESVMEMEHGDVILMYPAGFPPLFKPRGKYFDLCAQGRLLVLSCLPYSTHIQPLTRDLCLNLNTWCKAIASASPA